MIRVIVADHHVHVLGALVTMLSERPDVELVGEATDAPALLNLATVQRPDVVLLDRYLPGSSVAEVIGNLHSLKPQPFVIVMSSRSEDSRAALNAGADMFVSKSDGSDWLLDRLNSYVWRRHA